jgi:hypothetical protein
MVIAKGSEGTVTFDGSAVLIASRHSGQPLRHWLNGRLVPRDLRAALRDALDRAISAR